jgi:hypothetical protein
MMIEAIVLVKRIQLLQNVSRCSADYALYVCFGQFFQVSVSLSLLNIVRKLSK